MRPDFVECIDHLPTLPTVVTRLLDLLGREDASVAEMEDLIGGDPSLTGKLLSVANSPYYGFRHQITTVQRAVVAIGFREVRDICLGAGLMAFLAPRSFEDPAAAAQLWLHSLAVAEAGRLIAPEMDGLDPQVAYTLGLLHDLGLVVLAAFFPRKLAEIKSLMAETGQSYRECERRLEVEHGALGGLLARHWSLPPLMGRVMVHHHAPDPVAPDFPALACVHLADGLARELRLGEIEAVDQYPPDPAVLAGLGPRASRRPAWLAALAARREAVEAFWHSLLGEG